MISLSSTTNDEGQQMSNSNHVAWCNARADDLQDTINKYTDRGWMFHSAVPSANPIVLLVIFERQRV